MDTFTTTAARAGATAAGRGLAAVVGAVDVVRRARRPLHPRGSAWEGRIHRHGGRGRTASGVPWLDEPGVDDAVVRHSAAVGLPPGWPDVHGIAVRIVDDVEGPGDLLLATTGAGPITRFVLTAPRRPAGRCHGSLLPYRGPFGPLLLAGRPDRSGRVHLSWATLSGPWTDFGVFEPEGRVTAAPRFDAVLHPPPGLLPYPWVARLREPGYRRARRG